MIYLLGLNPAIDRVLSVAHFAPGAHARAELKSVQAAGKAANVARVLSALGTESRLRGFVGADAERFFLDSFQDTRVEAAFVAVAQPTRINTTIIDSVSGQDTHLREAGFALGRGDFAAFASGLLGEVTSGDTAVLSGSLPRGIAPEEVAELLLELKAKKIFVAVDCNGPLLKILTPKHADFLKPNREELAEMLDLEIATRDKMLRLLADASVRERLPEHLLVSDGKAGCGYFACGGGAGAGEGGNVGGGAGGSAREISLWCVSAPVEAVSTVGAGDASLAGFLAGRAQGLAPEQALALAAASGASAVEQERAGVVDARRVKELAAGLRPFKAW